MRFGYKRAYIGGKLVDAASGEKAEVICPATDEAVAEVAWCGKEDAAAALEAAKAAFPVWSRAPIKERAEWMLKLRAKIVEREDSIREAVLWEMGKPWPGTGGDYGSLINSLEYYAHAMQHHRDEIIHDLEGGYTHQIVSEAAGVAVGYLAWNFPLLNLGFKLGPALAAGCPLIVKPSAQTPLSAYVVAEAANEIGFPRGVINVLAGSNSGVSERLSSSRIPRVITMIGSSETGRLVMRQAATSMKRFGLELGGNAPAILFEDGDLEAAVKQFAAMKFSNCGQICVSPNRIFAHRSLYGEFRKRYVEAVKALTVGFCGREKSFDVGPLIDARAKERIEKLVADTLEQGAKLECGGRTPPGLEKGCFYEPTVFSDVTPEMSLYQEEIFGPLAGLIPFDTDEEVTEMANGTEVGLASYVFTRDLNRANRMARNLEIGEVHINGAKWGIYLPHGGFKESGLGHDCSHLALEDYLVKKRISTKLG